MMHFVIFFVILSFVGLVDSAYLIFKHHKREPLVCPITHNCNVVTESKWSKVFIIRNDILGAIFYLAMLIGIILFLSYPMIKIYLSLFSGIGLLFSIFLIFIQIYQIKDFCFYCIISAIISFLIFINSFLL
jgi:uncharacterized membrane protein|tara:strand:- start:1576 stop:1968 length:393 start_codon:yes stop_codon:yes gene_type:complete